MKRYSKKLLVRAACECFDISKVDASVLAYEHLQTLPHHKWYQQIPSEYSVTFWNAVSNNAPKRWMCATWGITHFIEWFDNHRTGDFALDHDLRVQVMQQRRQEIAEKTEKCNRQFAQRMSGVR